MNVRAVECARCRQPWREAALAGGYAHCPHCGREQRLQVFPALVREAADAAGEALLPGESSCFYHEAKRAAVVCDDCGRFLCTLCAVDVVDRHSCPACVDRQVQHSRLTAFDRGRFLSPQLALWLAVGNLLVGWCLLGLPGLAAVGFGVYAWVSPKAAYQRSKLSDRLHAVAAMVLGLGGTAGQVLVLIGMIKS